MSQTCELCAALQRTWHRKHFYATLHSLTLFSEMLTRNGYGNAVDWWAFGALAFELLVGRAPFTGKTSQEVERKVLSEKPVYPSFLQQSTHSLLKGLLEKDPGRRLGAAKSTMFAVGGVTALKQHPFFGGTNFHCFHFVIFA